MQHTGILVFGICPVLKKRLAGIVHVTLVETATEFRQYFDVSFPRLVLIADPAILNIDVCAPGPYSFARALLPLYLKGGGTIVFGYGWPSIYSPDIVPWRIDLIFKQLGHLWTRGQDYNGQFLLNPTAYSPDRGRPFPECYETYGVMLKGAKPEEMIYVPGPYTSLDILKQPPLDPNQALVVGARSHENGYVGYIGGSSSRDQFVDILLAFFGTGF